jgi:cytochrome c biogenesis protein CcdA
MLPAYVALYLGAEKKNFRSQSPFRRSARVFALSGVVTVGFVALFGVIGAILSLGGRFLLPTIPWAAVMIGVILIVLGIYTVFGGHLYTSLPQRLAARLGNPDGSSAKGFLIFGIAYAITALSCALPIFLIVVGSAVALKGFGSGILQFISFALGMGFVIVLITLGSAFFSEALNRWLHRLVPVVARFSGLLLIFAGGYILYYWFTIGDILNFTLS